METETPPWENPAVGGEEVGTAGSREQRGPPCTRQGEAERVKRSHCEPASEPVAAPHHPPGRPSQAQRTLGLKGLRRRPAAGATQDPTGPHDRATRWFSEGLQPWPRPWSRGGVSDSLLLFQLLMSL